MKDLDKRIAEHKAMRAFDKGKAMTEEQLFRHTRWCNVNNKELIDDLIAENERLGVKVQKLDKVKVVALTNYDDVNQENTRLKKQYAEQGAHNKQLSMQLLNRIKIHNALFNDYTLLNKQLERAKEGMKVANILIARHCFKGCADGNEVQWMLDANPEVTVFQQALKDIEELK